MRTISKAVIPVFILLLCTQCSSPPAPIMITGRTSQPDTLEMQYRVAQPYIDYAFELTGSSRRNIMLPQEYEAGCLFQHRVPLVDDLLARPFAAPLYAVDRARRIKRAGNSPQDIFLATFNSITDFPRAAARLPRVRLPYRAFRAIEELDEQLPAWKMARLKSQFNKIPKKAQKAIALLLLALNRAAKMRALALKDLDEKELNELRELLPRFLPEEDEETLRTPEQRSSRTLDAVRVSRLARKIDYTQLFCAAFVMHRAIDRALPNLVSAANEAGQGIIYEHDSPVGKLVIGGTDSQTYEDDCAVIIDFGGNDTYRNNAGGSFRVGGGIAIVIDISGDDTYEAAKDHSQGAGALGVGALIDMAGDDSYTGKRFSQGCGFIGTGMLYDYKGNDAYKAESFCQGAAAFGAGFIWEGGGDDSYKAVSLAQAAGATMGIGAVIEHGGDDAYECESGGQGFGSGQWTYPRARNYAFCGGLGLMLEYGGSDKYACKKFAQGAGRLMGAGILLDEGGNDAYSADEHAAGDGSHLAFGMLIDKSGNDSYESRDQSIGASLDRSAGILLDMNGDDRYKSGMAPGCLGRAAGPGAFALMIDFSGNDKYAADEAEKSFAPGSVLPPAFWNESPAAVFIDLDGKDEYGGIGKNNANWIQFGQGAGIDTEDMSARFSYRRDYPSLMKYGTETLADATGETAPFAESANLFERFHELAPFVFDFSGNADRLFLFPNHPSPLVRDAAREAVIERAAAAKWGIESFGLKSARAENGNPRPPEKPAEALTSRQYSALLKSSYVDTRVFGAVIARYTADRSAAAHLLKSLRDDDAQVRRFSAAALGSIADENTLPALLDALAAEDVAVAREAMASALGKFKNREAAAALCEMLRDDCPGVRAAACTALGAIGDGSAVEKTSPLLKDRSEFVRRAAALALMETVPKIWGYDDADVAIGFLDHANKEVRERMLDALKKSTRQDFGYDKKKWLDWLDKNRPRTSR